MIYLLRHGLDDERYIGGWSSVDLIPEGIVQVQSAAKFINGNLNVNGIISSDIKRAISTANIVNEKLNINIRYTDELRELDKGIYTGVLKNTLSDEELDMIKNMGIYDKYSNGEAMIDLYNRMKEYLYKLKDDDILLVTHRGVINMFYYLLNDISLDMNKERFNVTHGSVHEMDINRKIIRRIY